MQTTSRGDNASPSRRRAVAYLRVDTDSQAKGQLAEQLTACRAYCQEHNVELADWHIDAIRGRSVRKERPGLLDALADLGPGDVLLVSAVDRLFRSTTELVLLNETIASKGCTLIAVDLGTAAATAFMLGVLRGLADIEREYGLSASGPCAEVAPSQSR